MAKRTAVFLREFVILFGFLNGVWLAVGVNPGKELLDVVKGSVEGLLSGTLIEFLFVFLPLVLLVATLWLIYKKGGWVGFLAVGCAFLGGAEVLASPRTSLVLLAGGLVLGVVATKR